MSGAVIAAVVVLLLPGCDWVKDAISKFEKKETSEQNCNPNLPATGEKNKVPDPVHPSFCTGPVMWCSYCEYSAEGALIDSNSRPCGVCIQGETK
jgi:hypothetical protein